MTNSGDESQQEAPHILTPASFAQGLSFLAGRDRDLAVILETYGPPPLWEREPGFSTLIWIILEQQVSLASAKAVYDRLLAILAPLTPEGFLKLDDATLKSIGFSRQKIAYGRHLAEAIIEGEIELRALESASETDVLKTLTGIKGIGPWTAEIYMLRALGKPDAWPAGDLALALAVRSVKRLPSRPTPEQLIEIGESWRPWRSVAARLLWNYYLKRPKDGAPHTGFEKVMPR